MPAEFILRLVDHCLQNPNAEEDIDSDDEQPCFNILGGDNVDGFATFYLDEDPSVLMLRCSDSDRQRLEKKAKGIVVSDRMCWDTTGWEWTDVPLDGTLTETELISLLVASHKLAADACNYYAGGKNAGESVEPSESAPINMSEVKNACEAVASSIVDAMKECALEQPAFSVSLILNDDMEYAMLAATSKDEFDSNGWDVHSWEDNAEVQIDPLEAAIGDFEMDSNFIRAPATREIAACWLAALVWSMHLAKLRGAFGESAPYLFCTFTDNSEALWLSHLSAKAITEADTFERYANDVAKDMGCRKKAGPLAYGNAELQQAFQRSFGSLSE